MTESTISSAELRPTHLEVNLSHLRHNYRVIARHVAPARVMLVLKANAYGHGLVAVARMLEGLAPYSIAVAYLEEALRVREAGVRTPCSCSAASWARRSRVFSKTMSC
ncbi:MAG: alanine racemase [Gammaproteobacteria bacterium]